MISASLCSSPPKTALLASFIGSLVGALFSLVPPAVAQTFTPPEEIWQKSQILNPKPSLDTTPVTVKVVAVTYRIPRNYLTYLEPMNPAIKVTFPGFKPLTEETRDCFDPKWQARNPGVCTTIEFFLLGSRGPGPGGRALTNAEMFQNLIKGLDVKRGDGPFGYDLYEIGPEEARIEVYRRTEGDIFFTCSLSGAEGRRQGAGCNDMFRLDDMNHVRFFFRGHQIKHIPEIEASIRRLMASFVTQGGGNGIDGVESRDPNRD